MTYFNMLVELGYKEIEISIPTASDTEYDFTRQIIETPGAVPDDIWLQVLCPCRLDLIQRTVQSLKGAKRAIISLYFASSPVWLDTVFQISQQDVYDKVVEAVKYAKSITKDVASHQGTVWNLMFSPEAFSGSDVSFCLRLCEAAKTIWAPTIENPIILNLPATVEMSTPNVYADQVEIFSRSISEREKVCVSLHVHNDRGCGVASAELGLMAGADRIEGCLFGNGERSGNVDLVTLALNLYTQGIDPCVDFSNISMVREVVEELTRIPVHPRAPYAGDLFFTAYSGAHQDAIYKGLTKYTTELGSPGHLWKVPYLTMDPEDLGSSHMDIIRLNSQSGKGGVAWTLFHELHIELPKGLQHHFSKIVKTASESNNGTIPPASVAKLFLEHYFVSEKDPRILSGVVKQIRGPEDEHIKVDALAEIEGKRIQLQGTGSDVISALTSSLKASSIGNITFHVTNCVTNSQLEDVKGMIAVECRLGDGITSSWGVRNASDGAVSELMAALSSVLNLCELGEYAM
ncbi:hypothetical protein GGR58DRAFT_496299 [Xylaria digitata]|nr:hypothetical protein GGR58DRAFT_496299 [Xylaria digitata]